MKVEMWEGFVWIRNGEMVRLIRRESYLFLGFFFREKEFVLCFVSYRVELRVVF